ncbi:tripartite tricarboxylate transporter TctB family protein [Alginatibacterium sediminis]|uniref:Tripartite tricarboxylate transporter TctB family protein n=1 Tax=Alginatibacterium sediminis TaxID=2164068 RepID=A0A420END8_9ALTE|nr:tripartite tricarboxylate transporter TctB family protein [Alginatibacterium sediminis]RKF22171.1 tripartite tricarboxylate transporter TctB family protein [Alginatibacterium sediminis]
MFNRHVVFPTLLLIVSAVVLVLVAQFDAPMYQQDASVDAKFFPAAIAIIQAIICVVLLIQSKSQAAVAVKEKIFSKMALMGAAYLIGYAILISFVGYLIASLVAFVAYLLYFRIKKPSYYIVAVCFVVFIYYLFGQVFYIALPEGSIF